MENLAMFIVGVLNRAEVRWTNYEEKSYVEFQKKGKVVIYSVK